MKNKVKFKRLVAFLLAMMVMVSLFSIPVAAAYDLRACPACGKTRNVGLWDHAYSWSTYGNTVCTHGGGGMDLLERGTCTLMCFDDRTTFSSTERSVLCCTGARYY